jgi:hypothetical protein
MGAHQLLPTLQNYMLIHDYQIVGDRKNEVLLN